MAFGDQSDRRGRSKRRQVVIVGAGFSGAALAAQLMRQGRRAPEVTLIERAARFGPGLAYGTADPAHRLNVRASNLSLFADDPDHFVRWQSRRARGDVAASFATRAQYGAYVEATLRNAKAGLFGPKPKLVRAAAVSARRAGDGWDVSLASGRILHADAVVLALGHPPGAVPAALDDVPTLSPWDASRLRRVRGDVLMLGTGLTMVDVALSLARKDPKRTLYALSRRGLTPRSHAAAHPSPLAAPGLPSRLSEALHLLRRRSEADWRAAIDQLRPHTTALWRSWPLEVQQRFLRHARPWWDVHRHRAAPEIAAELEALIQAGRLRVLAGEVVSAEASQRGVHILHRQRGSHVRHRLDVAAVINCTGANPDFRQWRDPLVRQLLEEGVVRAHANGRGLDVADDGRVIGAQGVAHGTLFALGPITQGAFWESTAVPEIRVNAAQIASCLS